MKAKIAKEIEKLDATINLDFLEIEKNFLAIGDCYERFVTNNLLKGILVKLHDKMLNDSDKLAFSVVKQDLQNIILDSKIEHTKALDLINYQCLNQAYHKFLSLMEKLNET